MFAVRDQRNRSLANLLHIHYVFPTNAEVCDSLIVLGQQLATIVEADQVFRNGKFLMSLATTSESTSRNITSTPCALLTHSLISPTVVPFRISICRRRYVLPALSLLDFRTPALPKEDTNVGCFAGPQSIPSFFASRSLDGEGVSCWISVLGPSVASRGRSNGDGGKGSCVLRRINESSASE